MALWKLRPRLDRTDDRGAVGPGTTMRRKLRPHLEAVHYELLIIYRMALSMNACTIQVLDKIWAARQAIEAALDALPNSCTKT